MESSLLLCQANLGQAFRLSRTIFARKVCMIFEYVSQLVYMYYDKLKNKLVQTNPHSICIKIMKRAIWIMNQKFIYSVSFILMFIVQKTYHRWKSTSHPMGFFRLTSRRRRCRLPSTRCANWSPSTAAAWGYGVRPRSRANRLESWTLEVSSSLQKRLQIYLLSCYLNLADESCASE